MKPHAFLSALVVLVFVVATGAAITQPTTTTITTYNPYRLTVELEVKCDWDNNIKGFRFHKFFTVPGKSKTQIVVPSSMKKCQIWPKISW